MGMPSSVTRENGNGHSRTTNHTSDNVYEMHSWSSYSEIIPTCQRTDHRTGIRCNLDHERPDFER